MTGLTQRGISIRPATDADSAAIAALAKLLGYDATAEQIAQHLRHFTAAMEHNIFVAKTCGGEVVGWIGMCVARSITSSARLEVRGLVVGENFRSEGVGALLLESAEKWAAEQGLNEVGVHTNVVRERAHLFYERHGYRLEKTQKFFRKHLKVTH